MKIRPAPPLPAGRLGRALALGIAVAVPFVLWEGVGAPLIAWYATRAQLLAERRELAGHMQQLAGAIPELERLATQEHGGHDAALLLSGGTDAIAAAAFQEKVQAMAAATGATLLSVETLPAQQLGRYRRVGLRISVYARDWPELVQLLRDVQRATPKMLISGLEVRAMPSREVNRDMPTSATVTIFAYRSEPR